MQSRGGHDGAEALASHGKWGDEQRHETGQASYRLEHVHRQPNIARFGCIARTNEQRHLPPPSGIDTSFSAQSQTNLAVQTSSLTAQTPLCSRFFLLVPHPPRLALRTALLASASLPSLPMTPPPGTGSSEEPSAVPTHTDTGVAEKPQDDSSKLRIFLSILKR